MRLRVCTAIEFKRVSEECSKDRVDSFAFVVVRIVEEVIDLINFVEDLFRRGFLQLGHDLPRDLSDLFYDCAGAHEDPFRCSERAQSVDVHIARLSLERVVEPLSHDGSAREFSLIPPPFLRGA